MKPHAGYLLAALLLAGAFAALGTWQLGKAGLKRERLAQQDAALQRSAPRPLAPLLGAPGGADAVDRVAGRGRYLAPLLLLDQQQRGGRVGVRVYGVAEVEGAASRLLVDLGWIAMPGARTLPQPPLPGGDRALEGLLAPWPGQGLRLAENAWPEDPAATPLLTHLDRTELQRRLGLPLDARVLRLSPALDYGHARDLDLLPNTLPPERHLGYAVQWYALATAVLVTFLLLSRRARRKDPA